MLENSAIVLQQVLIMFVLMAAGYFMFRRGVIDNHTSKQMSALLNTYVTPCCILTSFNRAFDPTLARSLGLTFLGAALIFAFSMLLANAVFRPGRPANYRDCRMCSVFCNNGFMALPLLNAMFGTTGMFLGSAHIVCMAIILWTYGIFQVNRDYTFSPRRILLNPGVIAAVLGLAIFAAPFTLPEVLGQAIGHLANLNTPLAMLVLGVYIAQIDLPACVSDLQVWRICGIRLLLIPLLSIGLLLLLPLDEMARLTLLVGTAAPSAIAAAMFAQIYGTDYLFSTRAVALSTLLSLITLPALIALMSLLLTLV